MIQEGPVLKTQGVTLKKLNQYISGDTTINSHSL